MARDPKGLIQVPTENGSVPGTAKLCDLGLLKLLDTSELAKDDGTVPTGTGTTLGTPHYMAPEQVRNKDITPKTDIYSLGVTTYKLITGRRAFEGDSAYDVIELLAKEKPDPIDKGHRLHRKMVLMQMAKLPENRPNLEEMFQILDVVDRRKKEKDLPLDLRNRMEDDYIQRNLEYVASSAALRAQPGGLLS